MTAQPIVQPPHMAPVSDNSIGRIVSVTGAKAIAVLNNTTTPSDAAKTKTAQMGTLIIINTEHTIILGLVSALSVPVPSTDSDTPELHIVEIELVGELAKKADGELGDFRRGLTVYPCLGDAVVLATREQLEKAYAYHADDAIEIGHIIQDETIPSMIRIDDLLGKHFAILGTTGTGKSCTVALILRGIIEKSPNAHIVLLDPHSEYASCFDDKAHIVTLTTLNLPFWLLNFEEITEIFVGAHASREVDIEILSDLIPMAKMRYASSAGRDRPSLIHRTVMDQGAFSVDTPVPYRISDLIGLLNDNIGKLDHQGALAPFKRIKARVEQISTDPRYAFMFGNLTVNDTMVDILSEIFRIPVNGKPITIMDLAGLPSEVVNVTVSVLSRMSFDFGLWSDGKVPITLVCEEAHRYVPNDAGLGFGPTKRAIARIAKEGRKYGISLGIISQRPSELDATILSQCNTIFAMRLTNEIDQEILRAAISDAASSLLEFLPSMGNREAVAFGEGISLPARIRFDLLPQDAMPHSRTREFSTIWKEETGDTEFLQDIVSRWRARSRPLHVDATPEEQTPQEVQKTAEEVAAYEEQQDRRRRRRSDFISSGGTDIPAPEAAQTPPPLPNLNVQTEPSPSVPPMQPPAPEPVSAQLTQQKEPPILAQTSEPEPATPAPIRMPPQQPGLQPKTPAVVPAPQPASAMPEPTAPQSADTTPKMLNENLEPKMPPLPGTEAAQNIQPTQLAPTDIQPAPTLPTPVPEANQQYTPQPNDRVSALMKGLKERLQHGLK